MKRSRTGEETSVETLLGKVADEFTERLHKGEEPDVEEYAQRFPELAAVIRQVLPAMAVFKSAGHTSGEGSSDLLDARNVTKGSLGDYRLIREIGRGGMGIVYEAIQVSLNRHVALKTLPQAAVMDPKQLQRFKNEAKAAARLHHDNIVPVYAVGCESGIHYYAMQYIDGWPLGAVISGLKARNGIHHERDGRDTTSIVSGVPATTTLVEADTAVIVDGESLSAARSGQLREMVDDLPLGQWAIDGDQRTAHYQWVAKLGIQAAQALHHAHEQGVIHRDVKPANLLLDSTSRVWVADFGLAVIQTDAGLTSAGDLLGTIRYMSPEQARTKSGPMDHRTDIYSLGATLYELLSLMPAFTGNDRRVLLQKIAVEEPRPLRKLDSAIPKPLETIIAKAMAKRADDRYATAEELADDLDRFLTDRPILAKPTTALDRLSMWARRHRPAVLTGIVLMAISTVGLAVGTLMILNERTEVIRQRNEAWQQRERAEAHYRLARDAMDRMLTRMSDEELGSTSQMERVRQALLEDSLDFHEQLLHTQSLGAAVRSETAYAYMRVGHINALLGQVDRAEEAYQKAVTTYERLSAEHSDVIDYAAKLANSNLALATLMWEQRRYADIEHPTLAALGILEQLSSDEPDSIEYRQALSRGHNLWGLGLSGQEQYDQAQTALLESIKLREELRSENPDDPKHSLELARTWRNLADVYVAMGHTQEAEATMNNIISIQKELVETHPEAVEYGAELAHTMRWWHKIQQRLAEVPTLPPLVEEQPTLIEDKQSVELPTLPWYQERLARAYSWLDDALERAGESDEAGKAHRHAVELQEELVCNFPRVVSYREELADLHMQRGEVMRISWRVDQAEEAYNAAINVYEELAEEYPDNPEYTVLLDVACSRLDELTGNRAVVDVVLQGRESLEGVENAVAMARATDPQDAAVTPLAALVHAEYLALAGDFDESIRMAEDAIDMGGTDCWYYKSLGWGLVGAGRTQEARVAFQQAMAAADVVTDMSPADLHPDALTAAYFLDRISVEEYTACLAEDMMTGSKLACYPWFYVGLRHELEGRPDEAVKAYERSLELGKANSSHHTVNWAAYRLSILQPDRRRELLDADQPEELLPDMPRGRFDERWNVIEDGESLYDRPAGLRWENASPVLDPADQQY